MEGKLVKGYLGLDVGDKVEVKLFRTDFRHGYVDFENPTGEGDEEEQKSQGNRSPRNQDTQHEKGKPVRADTRRKRPPRRKQVDNLAERRGRRK